MSFSKLPNKTDLDVQPFKAHADESQLKQLQQLLDLSPIGPRTYENSTGNHGITRVWLEYAKNVWLNEFDWRKHEDHINSFPNFKTSVFDSDGNHVELQFLALFSKRSEAIPIMFLHGWPSSILDYLDILDLLKQKYSPETLPYHVIVPSLPGYGYSSGLPQETGYSVDLAASALNNLMLGLGFSAYVAHGGDLGSFISRRLAMTYEACIGIQVTQMGTPSDGQLPMDGLEVVKKAADSLSTGFAFLPLQATRPATVAHTLGSSPLALLAWVGEKYLDWTDRNFPLEQILSVVTLYWLTDTIQRSMYHTRTLSSMASDQPIESEVSAEDMELRMKLSAIRLPYVSKPCGYSLFPREIIPIPRNWAELSCNVVSFGQHAKGGHFAAAEQPEELLTDIEEYIKVIKETYTKANIEKAK